MSRLKVYHFYNGSGGGVWSVIKNLVLYSNNKEVEHHIIHAIDEDIAPGYTFTEFTENVSQQICFYSKKNNFYHTCRKLALCIEGPNVLIIAHDWIELGMMSNLGLQHRLVFFLHGDYDYYYELAKKHSNSIDCFVTVAENIKAQLAATLPARTQDIYYQRFPVPEVLGEAQKIANSIIFAGRLEEKKGYFLLEKIAVALNKNNIAANWHIAGSAPVNSQLQWKADGGMVKFYGNLENEELLALFRTMECIVLPSLAEGMPLVIIEAMKAGVVPVVNDIPGGIQELVKDGETGYKIINNDPQDYVNKIAVLFSDKPALQKMSNNCKILASHYFDPKLNTTRIEGLFLDISRKPLKRKPREKVYGSRLDKRFLPNTITRLIRNF